MRRLLAQLLLTLLLTVMGAGAAQAQLTLCNRTERVIEVARAIEDGDRLVVAGWLKIRPALCAEVADNVVYAYAYYARQQGTDWVWDDEQDGVGLCVFEDRDFRINYGDVDIDLDDADDFSCPAGAEKLAFTVLENDFMAEHTVDLE